MDIEIDDYLMERASEGICELKYTKSGIYAELLDHYEASHILFGGGMYPCWYTYEDALKALLARYPDISLRAGISISDPYSSDHYEFYESKDGMLIRKLAARCTCCEQVFDLRAGVYPYEDIEELREGFVFPKDYVSEHLGICSLNCAKKLAEDPTCDAFELLEDIEAEGDSIEHIIEHYLENHPEEK